MHSLIPVFAQALTLTLSDTSDARARFDANGTYYDASTAPKAVLDLRTRRVTYRLAYVPSWSALDIGGPGYATLLFHGLDLSANIRFKRHSVTLAQSFGYGLRNFRLDVAPVAGLPTNSTPETPDTPPSDVPVDRPVGQEGAQDVVVTIGSSRTSLGLGHRLAKRVNLNEFVAYTFSGGMNDHSREYYPPQRGLDAGAGVGYSLSKLDNLSTNLSGSVFYTRPTVPEGAPRVRSIIGTLRESWTHRWAERFSTTFGVGVSYARTDEGEEKLTLVTVDVGPAGTFSAEYDWVSGGARYSLVGTVGSSPAVDRFAGVVDPRFFYGINLSRTKRRLTLTLGAVGVQSADPNSIVPVATMGMSLTALYEAADRLYLRAGGSASGVVLTDYDGGFPRPDLYSLFVGFSYALQPFKF